MKVLPRLRSMRQLRKVTMDRMRLCVFGVRVRVPFASHPCFFGARAAGVGASASGLVARGGRGRLRERDSRRPFENVIRLAPAASGPSAA